MKLINKWLRDNKNRCIRVCGYPILFILLFSSVSGCQKEELKDSGFVSTVVTASNVHFLLNFGIGIKDDFYIHDLIFINKYATKIVRFNLDMYNEIDTKSNLMQLVDEGIGIDSFPPIDLGSYGATLNICFGALINGDYYLVKLLELTYADYYIDSNNLVRYIANVHFMYKL